MYHSVTFDGKNSWDDWHLIPTSRPSIAQPDLKTNYVEIPGVGGSVDISDLLSGHPVYNDRKGNLEFIVMHDYWSSWETTRTEIANHLGGRTIDLVLEDDPSNYYRGRCFLKSYDSADWSKVTIEYTLNPFKRLVEIPSHLKNIKVTTIARLVPITGSLAYDVPTFHVTGAGDSGMYVVFKDAWYHLSNGANYVPEIEIGPGEVVLGLYGPGTVTIDYRRGLL